MDESAPEALPKGLTLYIALITCVSLAGLALAAAVERGMRADLSDPIPTILIVGFIATGRASVRLAPRTSIAVETTMLVATALLLGPGAAMVATTLGIGLAHAMARRSPAETVFNAAQSAFCVGVGSLVFSAAAPSIDQFAQQPVRIVVAALVTVAIMHGLSTFLVAAAGALQTGSPLIPFWRDGLGVDLVEQAALGLVGIAVAATIAAQFTPQAALVDAVSAAGLSWLS